MRRTPHPTILVFILLFMLASACASPTTAPPVDGTPQAIFTAAAQTMSVRLTLEAGGTAVAQLTHIAAQPTGAPVTVEPALPAAQATASPPPSSTPPPAVACDRAEFVGDVSALANATFFPGSAFTQVWRVRNTGSCAWTPAYSLVFINGAQMAGPTAVFLPSDVRPGDTVDLSVTLTAPEGPGVYSSDWLLRNPAGVLFGTGADASQPLTLQVQVAGAAAPAPKGAYDFVARACDATWRSATAALGCPGVIDDPYGSVTVLDDPALESRQEDEPALWTRPNAGSGGSITGLYPGYVVQPGDRFRAEVGCMRDRPGCDLVFRLDYRTVGGTIYNLGQWREVYDGSTTGIDIDLSSLAGNSVGFIFSVENRGDPEDADGIWFSPYILSTASPSSQVLNWNQHGGPKNVCQQLSISLTGREQGTAQARSCRGGVSDLGSLPLTAGELDQLLAWRAQLAPFDAELFNAELGEPLTSFMTFTGAGTAEATDAYITAMQTFAERLYNRIAG